MPSDHHPPGDGDDDAIEHYVHGREQRENVYVWWIHWYHTELRETTKPRDLRYKQCPARETERTKTSNSQWLGSRKPDLLCFRCEALTEERKVGYMPWRLR